MASTHLLIHGDDLNYGDCKAQGSETADRLQDELPPKECGWPNRW
jgi:hypothetical protein